MSDSPPPTPSGSPDATPRWLPGAAVTLGAVLGLVLVLGLASLVGEGLRSAVLVEVATDPTGSLPAYTDAPREATRFFQGRDTLTVRVPRDMRVADFLALYHLETNAGARDALREQLGVVGDADVLREGDEVVLPLTVRRGSAR